MADRRIFSSRYRYKSRLTRSVWLPDEAFREESWIKSYLLQRRSKSGSTLPPVFPKLLFIDLYALRTYARQAMLTGVMTAEIYQRIAAIQSVSGKAAANLDEKRPLQRRPVKRAKKPARQKFRLIW